MTSVLPAPALLDAVLDPEALRPHLRSALQGAGSAAACEVTWARPLVWKPESRALVAYALRGAGMGGCAWIFGKHFARPARAQRVHATWSELEAADFGPGAGVPRLAGFLPELSMVLYLPARGRPLDLLPAGALEAAARSTGRWLAALHAAPLPLERELDTEHEAAQARDWAERVAGAEPRLGAPARRLAAVVTAAVADLRFDRDVPIHKDFHYRHVIVGPRLVALDFDEMRMGDRSFDLAHFCAYLRLLAVRRSAGGNAEAAAERAFLGAYAAATGWRADARFACMRAYACLKIAKQLCAGSGVLPRPAGAERARQLAVVLDHGLRSARAAA